MGEIICGNTVRYIRIINASKTFGDWISFYKAEILWLFGDLNLQILEPAIVSNKRDRIVDTHGWVNKSLTLRPRISEFLRSK
jgi:hypothetical protein